jgi:hypothetical protein
MRFATPRAGSRLTRILTTFGLAASVLALGAPPASAIAVSSVSVGAVHACVRTTGGAAKCWGYNDVGMLGDGTRTDSLQPVTVDGLGSGVADVQAVWDHSCALLDNGGVMCWGHNGDGELGDGSLIKRLTPVYVQGLHKGVQQISLGFDSGCALTNAGGVKCWGYNGNGQLGDGTRTTRRTPVDVFGLTSGVAAITAGWDHTCALTTGGGVKCWGQNAHGELGDGSKTDRLKPVDVSGLTSGVAAVSAGFDQTCALLNGGGVQCWGNNKTGEVGDGTTKTRAHPVDVSGLTSGVASISAGYNHTCAVTNGGGAMCWGANESGELGDGTKHERHTPVDVYRATSGVAQVSAGGWRGAGMTCLVTTQGAVQCFGANHGVHGLDPITSHGGQLGDGTKIDRHIPITVRTLNGSSPAHYRPDALISKSASGGFAGNNIYNKTGKNQTRTQTMNPGGTRHFHVQLQNDASVSDSFFVVGSHSGHGFTVGYATGGNSIKADVVSGEYWFTLAPGGEKTIVITVTAKSGISAGAKRTLKVLVRSAGDSAKLDVVNGIVKV